MVQGLQVRPNGRAHTAAKLFGSECHIHTIQCQVICPGRACSAEAQERGLWSQDALHAGFSPGMVRSDALGLKAWIGSLARRGCRPAEYTVDGSDLLHMLRVATERSDFLMFSFNAQWTHAKSASTPANTKSSPWTAAIRSRGAFPNTHELVNPRMKPTHSN